jgi:hypothetical protein
MFEHQLPATSSNINMSSLNAEVHDYNPESILTDLNYDPMKSIEPLFLNVVYEGRVPIGVMCNI